MKSEDMVTKALLRALKRLVRAASMLDGKLAAGQHLPELTTEQSRLYNAVNDAKEVIAQAKKGTS